MLTALLIEYCLQIAAQRYKDVKGKAELLKDSSRQLPPKLSTFSSTTLSVVSRGYHTLQCFEMKAYA